MFSLNKARFVRVLLLGGASNEATVNALGIRYAVQIVLRSQSATYQESELSDAIDSRMKKNSCRSGRTPVAGVGFSTV